jgi:hypothetical protein
MQDELTKEYPGLSIQILGVNQVSHESGNPLMAELGDLPWLQDVDTNQDGVGDLWSTRWHPSVPIAWRDVWILDANNVPLGFANLTEHNLADQTRYNVLKQAFVVAASPPGDSNHDGVFNSADLVQVLTAGEFEDNIPQNSTFEEGDWNLDRDFTTADFVFALQAGTYTAETALAIASPAAKKPALHVTDKHAVDIALQRFHRDEFADRFAIAAALEAGDRKADPGGPDA